MRALLENWIVFAFSLNCVMLISLTARPRLLSTLSRRSAIIGGSITVAMFTGVTLNRLLTGSGSARVFQSLWSSGDALWRGLDPYSISSLTWVITYADGSSVIDLNLNPPALLPILQLVALQPLKTAAAVWAVGSAALYVSGVALSIRRETTPVQIAWALMLPIIGDTILVGQIYSALFLLAVAVWIGARENRLVLAGIALGVLISIKPNFGLCILMLLAARHFQISIAALATTMLLSAFPIALYGSDIYLSWFRAAANDQHFLFPFEISLAGYFSRLGARPIGLGAGTALAVAAVVFAYRTRMDLRSALLAGLTTSVLASPLGWYHYLIVLVPALIERPWTRSEAIAAGLLFVPIAIPANARWFGPLAVASVGAIYTVAALLLLVSFFLSSRDERRRVLGD